MRISLRKVVVVAVVLAATVGASCRKRWDGSNEGFIRPIVGKSTIADVPVGTRFEFGLKHPPGALVVAATSTPMCRRGAWGEYENVLERFSTENPSQRKTETWPYGYSEEWLDEAKPCPGVASTPLAGRAVRVEAQFDFLGDAHMYWDGTTGVDGRASFDATLEGAFAWTSAFCGRGTLRVHAVALPAELPTAGTPDDKPTAPRVTESGELIAELTAPPRFPWGRTSYPFLFASSCLYGGGPSDAAKITAAMAVSPPDTHRAMALNACLRGIGASCREACADGDPLGCHRECKHGGGMGCDAVGVALRNRGGPGDAARAATYFAKGCGAGTASACGHLAGALERGEGVAADPTAAAEAARAACIGGDGGSCAIAAANMSGGAAQLAACFPDAAPSSSYAAEPVSCDRFNGGCTLPWAIFYNATRQYLKSCAKKPTEWVTRDLCKRPDGTTGTYISARGYDCPADEPSPPAVTAPVFTKLVDQWGSDDSRLDQAAVASRPGCTPDRCECFIELYCRDRPCKIVPAC
ncbi:MAG: hypothetical protein H6Q90_2852 [Deltaproteobacteria bacterium]|nr:hypothetical protein [Deltaproteobacteria bacterium]